MEKSKAKKAVKKSESRKQQAAEALALAAAQATGGNINPELQSQSIDLQPVDGYVNPYHAMGSMAPTAYSAGNLLPGYNYPVMVNPEA